MDEQVTQYSMLLFLNHSAHRASLSASSSSSSSFVLPPSFPVLFLLLLNLAPNLPQMTSASQKSIFVNFGANLTCGALKREREKYIC